MTIPPSPGIAPAADHEQGHRAAFDFDAIFGEAPPEARDDSGAMHRQHEPKAWARAARPGRGSGQKQPYRSRPGTYEPVLKSVLEDGSLDPWEFRLLLYMTTKPEGFKFYPRQLEADGNLPAGPRGGRSWIRPALSRLHAKGFAELCQDRAEGGLYGRTWWALRRDRVTSPGQAATADQHGERSVAPAQVATADLLNGSPVKQAPIEKTEVQATTDPFSPRSRATPDGFASLTVSGQDHFHEEIAPHPTSTSHPSRAPDNGKVKTPAREGRRERDRKRRAEVDRLIADWHRRPPGAGPLPLKARELVLIKAQRHACVRLFPDEDPALIVAAVAEVLTAKRGGPESIAEPGAYTRACRERIEQAIERRRHRTAVPLPAGPATPQPSAQRHADPDPPPLPCDDCGSGPARYYDLRQPGGKTTMAAGLCPACARSRQASGLIVREVRTA